MSDTPLSGVDPLRVCLQGWLPAQIAIARLLLAGVDPATIRSRVQALRTPGPAWAELDRLTQSPGLERLRQMLEAAGVDHAAPATPAGIAGLFDRAVAVSPEGSVALYSLGDPSLLQAATAEIVTWLQQHRLIADRDVLDLGCGIGRIALAIAPLVRSVVGIDVSPGMIRAARQRGAGARNVSFSLTTGRDLERIAPASCDLVLAVDSFPYLMQAGVAEQHVAESHRVLRPGGTLAVLNLSYRNNPSADRVDAADWACRYGFSLRLPTTQHFRLWDCSAFVFDRT